MLSRDSINLPAIFSIIVGAGTGYALYNMTNYKKTTENIILKEQNVESKPKEELSLDKKLISSLGHFGDTPVILGEADVYKTTSNSWSILFGK